jgi:hypothetical protein
MNMKYIEIILIIVLSSSLLAQSNGLQDDLKYYGRKQPLSLGSAFGALGTSPILVNPGNVAWMTDNRISAGVMASGSGYGYYISWLAPNFSISNARQINYLEAAWTDQFRKDLLQFNFGISNNDLGLQNEDVSFAAGMNFNHLSDRLDNELDSEIISGEANTIDVGILVKWQVLILEMTLLNMNEPSTGGADSAYQRGWIIGGRYENQQGLKISLQGMTGAYFAGTDFGLNLGAEQSFLERRLVSRFQLTYFYDGASAVMQNLSGSLGYRFSSKGRLILPLKDLEMNYTLSFLAMPKTIGTHMLVLTKYF